MEEVARPHWMSCTPRAQSHRYCTSLKDNWRNQTSVLLGESGCVLLSAGARRDITSKLEVFLHFGQRFAGNCYPAIPFKIIDLPPSPQ